MTRISHAEHYRRYRLLHTLHEQGSPTVALLPAGEQWVLHNYYRFTVELTPDQLAQHIREVSATRPSLPNRAGKAFRQVVLKYERLLRYLESQHGKSRIEKNATKQIYVFSEVQPELDPKRVAKILIEMALTAERGFKPQDRIA